MLFETTFAIRSTFGRDAATTNFTDFCQEIDQFMTFNINSYNTRETSFQVTWHISIKFSLSLLSRLVAIDQTGSVLWAARCVIRGHSCNRIIQIQFFVESLSIQLQTEKVKLLSAYKSLLASLRLKYQPYKFTVKHLEI